MSAEHGTHQAHTAGAHQQSTSTLGALDSRISITLGAADGSRWADPEVYP